MILSLEEIENRIADSYELPNKVVEEISEPIVSVRTSTYNHAPYIKQCIEGVLMQKTTFPFEFIIGEDFSTDETRDIVFEYAKKYPNIIRVVTADYNVGSKANGQRCIRRCRGKYVAICEGDDYWIDPLKLQKQVEFLEKNPEYGLIFTNVDVFYQKTGSWKRSYLTSKGLVPSCFEEHLINAGYIAPLTWMYRTEFLQTKPYHYVDGTFPLALDIWAKSKVYFLDEVTAVYRFLPESASHSKDSLKRYNFIKGVFKIQCDFVEKYHVDDLIKLNIKNIYIQRCFPYIILFESKDTIVEAKQLFKQISSISLKNRIILFMSYTSIGIFFLKIMYRLRDL